MHIPLSVICFLLFVVASSIINAKPEPLTRPVEFILLLDSSGSLQQENFDKLVHLINQWPDHFLIAENASRVAVIQFSTNAQIELPLTSDESKVRNLKPTYMAGNTQTNKALEMVKNKVLDTARQDAFKAVIVITDGDSTDNYKTKAAADEVRQTGAETYVLFIGDDYKKRTSVKNHVDNDIAGNPEHVFHVDDFDKLAEKFFKKIREQIECSYKEVCQFDGLTCKNVWVRNMVAADVVCTNKLSDQFKMKCDTAAECTKQCDKWKWKDANCDSNAGKKVTVEREGSMPEEHKAVFEKCPPKKEVECPTATVAIPLTLANGTMIRSVCACKSMSMSISGLQETLASKPMAVGKSQSAKESKNDAHNYDPCDEGDGMFAF